MEYVIAELKLELKKEVKQDIIENDGLATKQDLTIVKKDLELSISTLRYDTLKFVIWTGVAIVVTITGMLAKGFHWF